MATSCPTMAEGTEMKAIILMAIPIFVIYWLNTFSDSVTKLELDYFKRLNKKDKPNEQ